MAVNNAAHATRTMPDDQDIDAEFQRDAGSESLLDRSDLERNFGFLLHDIARLMKAEFDRRGREIGLTRSQWWVLNFVYAHEGATQTYLADVCEVERATMGRLLDKLEEKGWVRRAPDPQDRRIRRVHLTGEAEGTLVGLRKIAADVRQNAIDGLSDAAQAQFVDTLVHIRGNLSRNSYDGATEDDIATGGAS